MKEISKQMSDVVLGEKKVKPQKGKAGRRPPDSPPRVPLKKALVVASAIEEDNAGKPYSRIDLAQSIGSTPSSKVFRRLIIDSNKYGLTSGGIAADKIELTELGTAIVAPKQEGEREKGLLTALLKPPIFEKVLRFYDGKKIPPEDILKNSLRREFGVIPEDVSLIHEMLATNLADYGLVQDIKGSKYLQLEKLSSGEFKPSEEEEKAKEEPEEGLELAEELGKIEIPKPRVIFVAHGKNRKPLEQLKAILTQFKVPFKIAIDEPHKGRPITQKNAQLMRECTSGIFIFTADEETTDSKGEKVMRPSDNVVFELGAGIALYSDKIVILREEEVSFGSDFTDYGYITFEKDRLDAKAFDLMKELIGLGFLQVTPA